MNSSRPASRSIGPAVPEWQRLRFHRSAGFAVGVSLAFLVNVMDPDAVVVGGGLGGVQGLYWDEMVASARKHVWSTATRELPILRAGLGPDAGVVGAAAMVFDRERSDT